MEKLLVGDTSFGPKGCPSQHTGGRFEQYPGAHRGLRVRCCSSLSIEEEGTC
jgi:hypothetical protein